MSKDRRGFVILLIGAAVLIWGYNLYQVAAGVGGEPAASDGPATETRTPVRIPAPAVELRAYSSDFPDPFVPRWSSARVRADPEPDREIADPPPLLQLTGIVGNTAILRSEEGTVYVAPAGGRVGEARLESVAADYVVLRAGGRQITLHLTE